MIYRHCPYSFVSKLLWSQKVLLSLTRSIYNYSTALKAHLHPGANRVHRSCTRVQMKKRTLVRRVQLHPGANAGKAFISTALEPVWKFISFSHDRSRSGEHIVHIDEVTGSLLFRSYYSILNSSSLLNFQQSEGFYERIFACYPIRSAIFGHF